VIEFGAGIGDHTSFFLDRGCEVVVTEGRAENVALLRRRFPDRDVRLLDLDDPDPRFREQAEIVYCYGTLYHLSRPAEALARMASCATELLLLETCVSPGDDERVNAIDEDASSPSQSVRGRGCRPTRPWVWARLAESFRHVYATRTQPWHEEFPLDWRFEYDPKRLTRAVFVGSRTRIDNRVLTPDLLERQTRH
jgi:hypothetical protein